MLGTFRSLGALSRAVGPIIACAAYWKLGSASPYYGAAALVVLPILLAVGRPAVPGRSAEAPPDEEGGAGPEADGAEEEGEDAN